MRSDVEVDAIVVGAGVGGLCTAARLSAGGRRVLVVERLRHLGGRFSTREIDGFKLPTGAFMIATDDPLAWTFRDLGLPLPVREATERPSYLIAGELVDIGERGGLRTLVAAAARHDHSDADAVMAAMRDAISGAVPPAAVPLPDWLAAAGAGPAVAAVLEANTRAYLGVNAHEMTASAFFEYLRVTAGGARYGIPPGGGRAVVDTLGTFIEASGGRIELGCPVESIIVDDDPLAARGIRRRDGSEVRADLVVSGVGLEATGALLPAFARPFLPPVPPQRNAPGITSFIASRRPFFDRLAVTVTGSRAVCVITTPTLLAPELAPAGWHLTESLSTFRNSTDQSDPKGELDCHLADLDELLPRWREQGRLLQTATYRGAWPVGRSWIGHDPQERFPLPGLALVGDSVKAPGWTGVGAVAEGARLMVEALDDSQPVGATR